MSFKSAFLIAMTVLLATSSSFAKDIIFKTEDERIQAIKNGRVWSKPEWMSTDFQFSDSLDMTRGAPVASPYELLFRDEVFCVTTEQDQQSSFGGKTPKFYCQLIDSLNSTQPTPLVKPNGKTVKIKVKYPYAGGKVNNEIYGEILGTRLLWALGFAADQMFYVSRTHCYGCSEDPYKARKVDAATLSAARTFSPTAIEVKLPGSKMVGIKVVQNQDQNSEEGESTTEVEGFSFKELIRNLPDDANQKYNQFVQREALRAMAVFLQHLDLKAANQKILCPSEPDANGACPVQPILYIQDIGASFGVSVKGFTLDKVNLKTWSKPFWLDPATCQTTFDKAFLRDSSMKNTVIYEAGRKFLVQLLDGFSAGEAGRKRVEDLFRTAHIDQRGRGETIEMWRDAFYARLQQLKYPMGESQPNFVCPDQKKKN